MGAAVALASAAFAAALAPQTATRADCLKALAPLAMNSIPASDGFVSAACPTGEIEPAFHYDLARRCTRTARAITAGEIVPRYPEFGDAMIQPGQSLQLVVYEGPVRIERSVEAMQPAEPGQRLFVKTHDGQILSVRYESGGQ